MSWGYFAWVLLTSGYMSGGYLSIFFVCSNTVLNILVRNGSPRGHMCFSYLMFSLSGPCGFLFSFCFIASWT